MKNKNTFVNGGVFVWEKGCVEKCMRDERLQILLKIFRTIHSNPGKASGLDLKIEE
ncbi:hypothetical protein [Peribacillus butanolivorans]|uniref:hypothetical protein n=1 Tax=Peribacillus butanolivorans TaxID=421767 RepID=UPI0035DBF3A0